MTAADPVDISYDDIPYPDLRYRATHPGRLAAVAGLLDVQTVPVQECRVLEIGCAGGANIIPMAFGLPGSEFVGIDLSGRQIEAAQHFAAELGLRNLHLQAMDVMDVTPEFGTFDYIIATVCTPGSPRRSGTRPCPSAGRTSRHGRLPTSATTRSRAGT